jgi:DivIVA domain-containing protein
MELDRNSIVRSDFPLERRGYDRAAVDAHLDAVAIALAELVAARIDANTASTVSSKVESIVTAAEEAARRIEREAHERAREQEARVEAATNTLLERIDALRAGVEQLAGGLNEAPAPAPADKSGNGARDAEAFVVPVGFEPDSAEVEVAEPGPMLELVPEPPEASAPPQPSAESQSAKPAADDAARSTVVEDARLVALQMLLEGSSRDEVDGYLATHFELPDRARLLDDVVAAVGG